MSDEQAMEIIENLSEELGEKELKIMALEKELEEQKKEKMEYYDLCEIREYKITYLENGSLNAFEWEWCPRGIVEYQIEEGDSQIEIDLMCKVIIHYFGGRIMTKEEIIEDIAPEYDDFNWDKFYEDKSMDGDMTEILLYQADPILGDNDNTKYWCDF